MKSIREFWRRIGDEKAIPENMFVQIGRSSYTHSDFFLMIKDIAKSLRFQKEEVKDKGYNKVIVSSVLQYLDDYEQVEKALSNIHDVMQPEGKAIFTHNPDIKKKRLI